MLVLLADSAADSEACFVLAGLLMIGAWFCLADSAADSGTCFVLAGLLMVGAWFCRTDLLLI